MIQIKTLATIAALVAFAGAPNAFAHEAAKGVNGGWRVDAGAYHTEVVADGTATVTVYLSDANDKPLPSAAHAISAQSRRSARISAAGSLAENTA